MDLKSKGETSLEGLRILVAEDEFLIAVVIEETLRDAGADTLRAATVRSALKEIEEEPLSAALLDVRLGRQTTEELADALAARDIPFLFYSGQALPDSMRAKHPHAKLLCKPLLPTAVIDELAKIVRN